MYFCALTSHTELILLIQPTNVPKLENCRMLDFFLIVCLNIRSSPVLFCCKANCYSLCKIWLTVSSCTCYITPEIRLNHFHTNTQTHTHTHSPALAFPLSLIWSSNLHPSPKFDPKYKPIPNQGWKAVQSGGTLIQFAVLREIQRPYQMKLKHTSSLTLLPWMYMNHTNHTTTLNVQEKCLLS